MSQEKQYMFVCGTPRSGTTALWALLNCHSDICLTTERYHHIAFKHHRLEPRHFDEARMFELKDGDTFYASWPTFVPVRALQEKYASATFVGDKLPRLYEMLPEVAQSFGRATLVVILRNLYDVAVSYNARAADPDDRGWPTTQDYRVAVSDWNRACQALLLPPAGLDVVAVTYEDLFANQDNAFALFDRLQLSCDATRLDYDQVKGIYDGGLQLSQTRAHRSLTALEKRYLNAHGDSENYRKALGIAGIPI